MDDLPKKPIPHPPAYSDNISSRECLWFRLIFFEESKQ